MGFSQNPLHCGVVEVASRLAHNQKIGGSNPSPLQKEELVVFTVNLTVNQKTTKTKPTKFF